MTDEDNETTLIQVRKTTATRIKEKTEEFGDTYDSIITRALDKVEKKK